MLFGFKLRWWLADEPSWLEGRGLTLRRDLRCLLMVGVQLKKERNSKLGRGGDPTERRRLSKLISQTDFAAWRQREIHYGRICSSPRRLWFHLQRESFIPEAEGSDASAVTRSPLSHILHLCHPPSNPLTHPAPRKKYIYHQGLICRNKRQITFSQKRKERETVVNILEPQLFEVSLEELNSTVHL